MTHAELAAKLLREAAILYRMFGAGREGEMHERIDQFGRLYERVADLVERDPQGLVDPEVIG
jgi:hypothetical protein